MTIEVTRLDGVTVGRDDYLILRCPEVLTASAAERLRDQIPMALRDRVLVIDGSLELVIVQAEDVVLPVPQGRSACDECRPMMERAAAEGGADL